MESSCVASSPIHKQVVWLVDRFIGSISSSAFVSQLKSGNFLNFANSGFRFDQDTPPYGMSCDRNEFSRTEMVSLGFIIRW